MAHFKLGVCFVHELTEEFKENGYTFSGGGGGGGGGRGGGGGCNPSKADLSSAEKGVYSERKEFALWSKFFPFRVDSFSVGAYCTGKQTGRHKSCLPCKKGRKST